MKEKEFKHPETKSFDEQYGKLMQEELQRRREEQEARERAWAMGAENADEYEEEPAFEDDSNAGFDVSEEHFSAEEYESTSREDAFEDGSFEEVPATETSAVEEEPNFRDEFGNVDFSAIIEAEDLEEAPKKEDVEDVPLEEEGDFEGPYSEDLVEDVPFEAEPQEDDPEEEEPEEGGSGGRKPPVYVDEKTLKRRRKRRLRKLSRNAVLGILIVAVALVVLANTPLFAIKKIEVKGTHVHSKGYVVRHCGIKKGDNLFRIKTGAAAKSLEKSPYIFSAKVKRVLPDTCEIQVTERIPVAYLPYGSKYIVIDKSGTVIKVRNTEPSLTELKGFKIKDRTVGSKIGVNDQEKLNDCMDIIKAMKENNIFFKKIEAGDVVMRAYVYDRLVCRGTKTNLEKSIEDGTLAQVLQDLYKKKTKRGTVNIGGENYISFSPKVSK